MEVVRLPVLSAQEVDLLGPSLAARVASCQEKRMAIYTKWLSDPPVPSQLPVCESNEQEPLRCAAAWPALWRRTALEILDTGVAITDEDDFLRVVVTTQTVGFQLGEDQVCQSCLEWIGTRLRQQGVLLMEARLLQEELQSLYRRYTYGDATFNAKDVVGWVRGDVFGLDWALVG